MPGSTKLASAEGIQAVMKLRRHESDSDIVLGAFVYTGTAAGLVGFCPRPNYH